MTIRKIGEVGNWPTQNVCHHPEHKVPSMISLPPGVYEHECPGCGKKTTFTVRGGGRLNPSKGRGRSFRVYDLEWYPRS